MKDFILVIGAFVVFVIVFNTIEGSRHDKLYLKQLQTETRNCEEKGTILYIQPGSKNVCVPKRSKP